MRKVILISALLAAQAQSSSMGIVATPLGGAIISGGGSKATPYAFFGENQKNINEVCYKLMQIGQLSHYK